MKRGIVLWTILTFVLIPGLAHAEWFIEPYAGAAFTRDVDVDVKASGGGYSLDGELKSINLEDSITLGLRVGRWLDSLPNFGIGVDIFYSRPDIKAQTVTFNGTGSVVVGSDLVVSSGSSQAVLGDIDVYIVGFSADFMLRFPFGEAPAGGRPPFQPYIFVGPAWILTVADNDRVEPSLGLKTGAGLSILLSQNVAVFAEYRYTRFSPEGQISSGGVKADLETDAETHTVIGGISFRF